MSRRNLYLSAALMVCALLVSGLIFSGGDATQAKTTGAASANAPKGPKGPLPDFLRDMPEDMKINHGKYDNELTAKYEQWLNGETVTGKTTGSGSDAARDAGPFAPLYGTDVRMSSAAFAGSQNEFQIDINPTNSLFAIGTSNDGRTAGVGIYRTSDGGLTWTPFDAPIGTGACCDPAVSYAYDGAVYVGVLDTSPSGQHTIRSTDNGVTWSTPSFVALPDRNNIVVDNGVTSPRRGNLYTTYSDLAGGGSNRIKGYRSTDNGVTWGTSFFVGGAAPASGYQQSSQPRVASDGTLYVGYQQYTNSGAGCAAGVQNVLAKSTDGGATFTHTVLNIIQGGACIAAQAGRGIFCINAAGGSFRSRSHPIIDVHPTNPNEVYMFYTAGDLESDYTCGGGTGKHGDALFRRSTDGGATFTSPIRINSDPLGWDQYYGWIDVAPNGRIWAGWQDRRDDPLNFRHHWYQAFSNDGGLTWQGEERVSDVNTQPATFIGDYNGLAAMNDRVLGMWWDSRSTANGDPYTDPEAPTGPTNTPTATFTGTPPTATFTRTPSAATNTPTSSPTSCGSYSYTTATATIVPGTTDIGNACDDCVTTISMPFPFSLYGTAYTSVNVSSNGNLQFVTTDTAFTNVCPLPSAPMGPSIMPYWEDLRTDAGAGCPAAGCGIFTSVSGTAPNRIFNIEWRARYFAGTGGANLEARLYEGSARFDYVYGVVDGDSTSASIGVQNGASLFTSYSCNTAGNVPNGRLVTWTSIPCGPTNTPGPSNTPTRTNTPGTPGTVTPTSTPGAGCVLGSVLFTHNVEGVTNPPMNVALGVEYALGHFWVTGRDSTSNVKKIVKLSPTGQFVAEYPQEACAGTTFGYRDLAFDGQFLWTADECGVDKIDPNTGARVGGFATPPGIGTPSLARGLAFDPATQTFFAANFSSSIVVFDMTGSVVRTMPNPTTPTTAIYGIGFDSASAGGPYLWVWSQNAVGGAACPGGTAFCNRATRLNPTTGATTGVAFDGVPISSGADVSGGADVEVINGTITLVTLHQATPDTIRGYCIGGGGGGTPTNTPAASTPTVTPVAATFTNTPMRTNTPVGPSNTPARTNTPSNTPVGPSHTPTNTNTPGTPGATNTPMPSATTCPITFTDVMSTDYFYAAVRYLFCMGAVSGYTDNTFRPYNNTTRGQLSKIIVLAQGWPILNPPTATFQDVPVGSTFYGFVETAYAEGIISGYGCGTDCLEFRPNNNVTRGQLSKIVVLAMEWTLIDPITPTFTDVARGSTFYQFVETAAFHQIIGGYTDGTFRPGNNATRGQICVIIYRALVPAPPPTATTLR